MEDLDKEPELASAPGPDDDSAASEEPVIRLATTDEGKIKHLRLICHLLEEGFYDQAIEAGITAMCALALETLTRASG